MELWANPTVFLAPVGRGTEVLQIDWQIDREQILELVNNTRSICVDGPDVAELSESIFRAFPRGRRQHFQNAGDFMHHAYSVLDDVAPARIRELLSLRIPPRYRIEKAELFNASAFPPFETELRLLADGGVIDDDDLQFLNDIAPPLARSLENTIVVSSISRARRTVLSSLVGELARQTDETYWIFLGRNTVPDAIQTTIVSRPLIDSSQLMLQLASNVDYDQLDVAASFDRWARYRQSTRRRYRALTGRDARDFLEYLYTTDVGEDQVDLAIPDQVPAPLRLRLEDGFIVEDFPSTESHLELGEQSALLEEMMEFCEDVRASAYLSNTAPGVDRKLNRLSGLLSEVRQLGFRAPLVVRIGVLTGSLKDVTKSSKELPPAARSELLSLFVQLDLFLVQFEEWRAYVRRGAEQEWGRRVSDEYVGAISDVLVGTASRIDIVAPALSQELSASAENISSARDSHRWCHGN